MGYGDSISDTLPTVGGDTDSWGTELNTFLATVKNTLEAKVTSSELNLDATVDFNSNFLDEVESVKLDNLSDVKTAAGDVGKVYQKDGELYYTDASQNAVKITSSGSLNATGLAGIGGDYGGADPAALNFTAASSLYSFLEDTDKYGDITTGDIYVRERLTTSTNAIKVKSPASLAGDIDRVLLAANPASASLLVVSSAGVETATRDPSVDTVTTSGAITSGGSVGITGDATVSGEYKHGNMTLLIPAAMAHNSTSTYSGTHWNSVGNGEVTTYPIPLKVGDEITAITVRTDDLSAGAMTLAFIEDGANVWTDVTANGGDANKSVTGAAKTLATTKQYYFQVTSHASGGAGQDSYNIWVSYNRP